MFHRGNHVGLREAVAGFLFLGLLCTGAGGALAQADRDAAWQRMLEGITLLSNLSLIQDAVTIVNAGGTEADALRADPKDFLRRGGLKLEDEDLVMLIDLASNDALTPTGDGAAPPGREEFALSEVAIAFSGPERGVLIRRKLPLDAPMQSFESAAVDLTLWIEQSLGYIAEVVHRLESEEDAGRIEFFLAAPTEFFVEEAVRDRKMGTAITFSFLEQAYLIAYDLRRAGDTEVPQFVPEDVLSEPETVTIAIGYASDNWAFFVELAQISEFD